MSRLGIADLGVATLNDMRDHAAMIASIDPTVPLIADADTGYGGISLSSLKLDHPVEKLKVLSWSEELRLPT